MKPAALLAALMLCQLILLPSRPFARNLDEIKMSGKIKIAFTQTDYTTINYPLAIEFAKYLNVELEEITIKWDQAFEINGKIPKVLTAIRKSFILRMFSNRLTPSSVRSPYLTGEENYLIFLKPFIQPSSS